MRVSDFLIPGRENSKSGVWLAERIGVGSIRKLRVHIAAERLQGVLILPDGQGGYYLPDLSVPSERLDAERFIKSQAAAAKSIQAMTRALRSKDAI